MGGVTLSEETGVRLSLKVMASLVGSLVCASIAVAAAYSTLSFSIEKVEARTKALESRDSIWEKERVNNIKFRAQVRAALKIKEEDEEE